MADRLTPPAGGSAIEYERAFRVRSPDRPVIPYIEGDGIGPDIWAAARRVFDAAVAAAWAALGVDKPKWPLKVATDGPDRDGWTRIRFYDYQTSPNEKRIVAGMTRFAGGVWTVVIYDLADATAEKRGAQFATALGRLLPKGQARESFAGKRAHPLDEARLAELARFVETGMQTTEAPHRRDFAGMYTSFLDQPGGVEVQLVKYD